MGNLETNPAEEPVTVDPWECHTCRRLTDKPYCPECFARAPIPIEPTRSNTEYGTLTTRGLARSNLAVSKVVVAIIGVPLIIATIVGLFNVVLQNVGR